MSNGFPCPNPTCSHVFPAAAVAGAAVLTCPRCDTVFQFHASGAAVASGTTPSPSPRTLAPTAPPPSILIAQPVTPRVDPAAAPAPGGIDFGAADLLSPAAIRMRARRRGPWNVRTVVVLSFFLAAIGLVILLAARWESLVPQKKTSKRSGEETVFKGMNFRYQVPASGWWQDDKMKDNLRYGRLVLHRHSPASWFAVLVKDFKLRNPRPREMYAEAIHILEHYFKEHLEHELNDSVSFQERPAQVIIFRGQVNKQMVGGECWMFGHQGFGYWLLSWTGSEGQKQLENEFADLRGRFTFGDERKTWEENRPALREFVVQKAGCRLRDTEALWEEAVNPTDYDPNAVYALHARDQDLGAEGDRKLNVRIGATVLVLVLPKGGEDLKARVDLARERLLTQQKMTYPETTIEPFSDKDRPPTELSTIGNMRGHLGFIRVRNGETRHMLVVQAVIPRAEDTLVLQGECYWKQRSAWEDSILQLINSVQVGREP